MQNGNNLQNSKYSPPPTNPNTKRSVTKEDAEKKRYPDSKTPGVHKDSAPIGGG